MTNQQHPITPPPELVQQWHDEAMKGFRNNDIYECDIATLAARWGADQELEAFCELLYRHLPGYEHNSVDYVRTARRLKPPSLKEQALEILECIPTHDNSGRENGIDLSIIRRALEQLNDD